MTASLNTEDYGLPFCAVSSAALCFSIWGSYLTCRGYRSSFRLLAKSDKLLPMAGTRAAGDSALLREAKRQIDEYMTGRRDVFRLPVRPEGGTDFRRAVWRALCDIPYGETRTYADVARAVGRPRAARAVGAACHCNPVAIVVPCHRVVGSSGRLTGYAGGLDVKERLLRIEAGAAGR